MRYEPKNLKNSTNKELKIAMERNKAIEKELQLPNYRGKMSHIAEKYGISRQRVGQIKRRMERKAEREKENA